MIIYSTNISNNVQLSGPVVKHKAVVIHICIRVPTLTSVRSAFTGLRTASLAHKLQSDDKIAFSLAHSCRVTPHILYPDREREGAKVHEHPES